ncbi:MAG TPA: DNA recombination protein RmuC [Vicinamibacterales bacterium]|nr:DNA recombination protein RmuC [Vicinamibacterales bacterium]
MNPDLTLFGTAAAAFLVGLILAWTVTRTASARAMQDASQSHQGALQAQQTLFSETARRLGDVQEDLKQTRQDLQNTQLASIAIREENAQLRTEVAHQRQIIPEKVALVEQAQVQLKASFDALAGAALRATTEEFLKLADQKLGNVHKDALGEIGRRQTALDDLLKPIRDALSQVDVKLGEGEKNRIQTGTAIATLLRELNQQQERLRGETQNLVRALRTPNVRGRWGEMQLKRVVELAGMLDYCDFVEQPSLLGEQGRQRPDMVIKLPGGRTVVIDAKAPLEAYLNAQEATDDATRAARMADHARQVRDHMTKLGGKNYWEQVQPSPEFVVMFLPGEAFFQSALQQDPELIDFGVRCQVFPASPITLIALLQVVAHGWRHERLAHNAEEIQALGRELYTRVAKMTEYLDTLRMRLDSTVKAFNDAIGSYEGRVLVTARKFKELGATSGTEIEPLQSVDTAPRILQSANLLGLPEDVIDAQPVEKDR